MIDPPPPLPLSLSLSLSLSLKHCLQGNNKRMTSMTIDMFIVFIIWLKLCTTTRTT